MHSLIAQIQPVDYAAGDRARAYLDTLTKPPGSLGMLEQLAIQLSEISGERAPTLTPLGVVVFAADHGVAAEAFLPFPKRLRHRWSPTSPAEVRQSTCLPGR